jgi:hypothetical protein
MILTVEPMNDNTKEAYVTVHFQCELKQSLHKGVILI